MMTTTTSQLLDAAQTPGGKILDALEFPMSLASLDSPPKFSTDLLALRVVGKGVDPPTPHIRRGLAATAGARNWFHAKSNGLGYYIDVRCGVRIWIFIRDDEGKFLAIDCFRDFKPDEANGCQLEIILLKPRTRLYVLLLFYFPSALGEKLAG